MTLTDMIRKRPVRKPATANAATRATEELKMPPPVAKVATVAVASEHHDSCKGMPTGRERADEDRAYGNFETNGVLVVEAPDQRDDEIYPAVMDGVMQPASPSANPIYWEFMDGTWHGPVKPEYLGQTRDGGKEHFWVIVMNYRGSIRWMLADLLRSAHAFDQQQRHMLSGAQTQDPRRGIVQEQKIDWNK